MKGSELKANELIRIIRLYQLGITDGFAVRNALHCLFVEILLEDERSVVAGNFEQMLKWKARARLEIKKRYGGE